MGDVVLDARDVPVDLMEYFESIEFDMKDVFTINTKPYKGAHFAVFPPALVEPCIKAGTSKHGCCPKCGAPWKRIVSRRKLESDAVVTEARKPLHGPTYSRHKVSVPGGQSLVGYERSTIGWKPTCECDIAETIPCLVLDPFFGSGTVGPVCQQQHCRFVAVELNADSIKLALERLGLDEQCVFS